MKLFLKSIKFYINIFKAILIATKMTKRDVNIARDLFEKIFRFKKFPKRPPIRTAHNKGQ